VNRLALLVGLAAILLSTPGCALRYQSAELDYGSDPFEVAEIDGAQIRYDVQGPDGAEAVVLIHGFGSALTAWDLLVPALRDRYRVIRLDLAGFGLSSKYEGDYGPDRQAAIVLALMDRLGVHRAHLVAHSYGSVVALTMALQVPDRVGRVVLAGAWVYDEQVPWSLRSARTAGMGELIFGLWYAENLDWRFGLSFHDPQRWVSEEVMERSIAMLQLPGAKATALATVRGLDLADRQLRYGAVRAPVRLIYGESDQVARPIFGDRLRIQLPSAELHQLPYCGHFPMLEASADFNRLTREWLDDGRPRGEAP